MEQIYVLVSHLVSVSVLEFHIYSTLLVMVLPSSFSSRRKKKTIGWIRIGKDLGGVGGEETITRM